LVGPDGGQVHDTLEPLAAKIRALPPVWCRARAQVNVLNGGRCNEIGATIRERAQVAIGSLRVHEGISCLASIARGSGRVAVWDLKQATRRNRRGLAGS
jgi:hypothetical protein